MQADSSESEAKVELLCSNASFMKCTASSINLLTVASLTTNLMHTGSCLYTLLITCFFFSWPVFEPKSFSASITSPYTSFATIPFGLLAKLDNKTPKNPEVRCEQ